MKKITLFFIFIIFIITAFIVLFIFFNSNIFNNTSSNYNTSYLSYNTNKEINNNKIYQKEISSFSTEIKDKSPGRLNNIRLTCNAINNTLILPNEIFSFNEIVGKPTVEKGYMEAHVIIENKIENGIGGR